MRQGAQDWCTWDDPEGWDEEGSGRGIQDGETHVHPWQINFNVFQNHYPFADPLNENGVRGVICLTRASGDYYL